MRSSIDTPSGELKESSSQLHAIFGIALIAQVACWHFATPGPFLRTKEQSIEAASQSAVVAFVCLFMFPFAASLAFGIKPAIAGLRLGNWRLGLAVVGIGVPIVGTGMFLGSGDPAMLVGYPWPGKWLSLSLANMLIWFSIYSLYYFAFEFFYRAFLLRGLEPKLGLASAIWIQVLMSVAIHFGKPTPELLASIPAGFILGWIAWYTRSVWYVFLLHWAIGILNDLLAIHQHGWIDN